MITTLQRKIVIDHLKPLRPLKAAIFGSFARGENNKNSDLDILIYLDYTNHRISLLDIIGVEQNLSEALGVKVDLVTEKSLSPLLKKSIENDLQYIIE